MAVTSRATRPLPRLFFCCSFLPFLSQVDENLTEEERKARIQAAKLEAQRSELNETLPGKKLPIWKRKVPPEVVGASSTTVSPAPKTSMPTQTPTVDLLTSTPKPSKLTTDVSPQASTPISRPPTGWSIDTNYGRDISRGVLSRPKSGRDRDQDGHSDFLTNLDRAGQPDFLKFRGNSG